MATAQGYFVTGTDTGVGKTWATLGLMGALKARGLTVAGMKPVASGCRTTPAGLRNPDAELIGKEASQAFPYEMVNPYAYAPAIAPHIAAGDAGGAIELSRILAAHQNLVAGADFIVVEGVGGWRVPLNDHQGIADLARCLAHPVLLVVGLRLGCISHALMTAETIAADGVVLAGWIANQLDPAYERSSETVESLRRRLPAPLLGQLPWIESLDVPALAVRLREAAERLC